MSVAFPNRGSHRPVQGHGTRKETAGIAVRAILTVIPVIVKMGESDLFTRQRLFGGALFMPVYGFDTIP